MVNKNSKPVDAARIAGVGILIFGTIIGLIFVIVTCGLWLLEYGDELL